MRPSTLSLRNPSLKTLGQDYVVMQAPGVAAPYRPHAPSSRLSLTLDRMLLVPQLACAGGSRIMGGLRELQDAVMNATPGIDAYIAASRLDGFQEGYKAGLSEACKMLDETLLLENPNNLSVVAFKQALQQVIQSGA